jgi:hypothetical protein
VIPVNIASTVISGPAPEIPAALDEMIYSVTSKALAGAGLNLRDLSGAFMAASDLYDGRAISTMTLTGSTGSFHRNEMRVCNDSLAALMLAAAEIASGSADAVILCSWCKLSDADRDRITPLALEPVMTRPLAAHPEAVVSLRKSAAEGQLTLVRPSPLAGADVAVAMVLSATGRTASAAGTVLGVGASNGRYLVPGDPLLAPVAAAAGAALANAGCDLGDVAAVHVGGLHLAEDGELAGVLAVPPGKLTRQRERWADLGYAAGLSALHDALTGGGTGIQLIVSAGGAGYENAFATVVEVA